MSRRERVEEYQEREYYSGPPSQADRVPRPVRGRDLEEVYARRIEERDRDRQPEFLRNDYDRVHDQPLVLRKREVETFERPIRRRSRDRSPSIERERIRERVVERERDTSPSPPPVERTRTRIVERERERDRSVDDRYRSRYIERDTSPARSEERVRTRVVEREQERDRSPSRVRTTTRVVERERERDRSPSPLPQRERIRTRVVERERERAYSSSSDSSVSARPEPPIIRAPPIHQEIITHHRHIDHGYDYAAVPAPPVSRPRSRVRESDSRGRETEIDIYTGHGETEVDIYKSKGRRERQEMPRNGRDFYDDDYVDDRDHDRLRARTSDHHRSHSAQPFRDRVGPYESESDYYARKVDERAYIGEAYNGATRDWAIVDVPPGTERVKMDGIGGASEEITWQRYNGVRRSRFIPERASQVTIARDFEREEINDRRIGRPLPPHNPVDDMWTEITKDLVAKEAIEELGYDYEETEFFFYVFRYLRYEDVQELVDRSNWIHKERRSRIREMAHERKRLEERKELLALPPPPAQRRRDDVEEEERVIEREIIYPRGYR